MNLLRRSKPMLICAVAFGFLLAEPGWSLFKKHKPLVVNFVNSQGQDAGAATLTPVRDGVRIALHLRDLPEGEHAIHFHEHAVCDPPDFKTAGGHFNPLGKEHGTKNPKGAHAGDMPMNLHVEPDGTVRTTFVTSTITMKPDEKNSIFANGGTSIVIHEHPDDMVSQPVGNAGGRIACAVVKPNEDQ